MWGWASCTPGLPSPRLLQPQVYEDYDCTLHQTNIEKNNNKFYTIRLLQKGDGFSCQSLWGRVVSATRPSALPPLHFFLLSTCPLLPRVPQLTEAERPQMLTFRGAWHNRDQRVFAVGTVASTPLKAGGCRESRAGQKLKAPCHWRMQRSASRRNFGRKPRMPGQSGTTLSPTLASTRLLKHTERLRPRKLRQR